jgi:hypothetical protein
MMAEIDVPKSPPPSRSGPRDDSAGTLLKLAGGCCVTLCGCIFGPFLLFISLPLAMYGGVYLIFVSVVCMIVGCVSAYYTWQVFQKASG